MSSLRRGLVSLFLGTGFGQLSAALAILVTAAQYGTAALGVLGLVTALGSTGAILLGRRYELGLPSYPDESSASAILQHLRRIAVLAFAAATVFLLGSYLLWRSDEFGVLVATVPLAIASTLALDTELFQATRTKNMRFAGRARALLGIIQACWLLAGAIFLPTAVIAATSYPVARITAAAWLRWRNGRSDPVSSADSVRSFLKAHRDYPRIAVPTGLLANLSLNAPNFALNSIYGLEAGGVYFVALRLVGLPMQILGQAVSQVSYAEMAKLSAPGRRELLDRVSGPMVAVAGACVGMAAIATFVPVESILGAEWSELPTYLLPIALVASAQLYAAPHRHALLIVGKLRERLQIQLVRTAVIAATVLVVWLSNVSFLSAVWILSIVLTFAYLSLRRAVLRLI